MPDRKYLIHVFFFPFFTHIELIRPFALARAVPSAYNVLPQPPGPAPLTHAGLSPNASAELPSKSHPSPTQALSFTSACLQPAITCWLSSRGLSPPGVISFACWPELCLSPQNYTGSSDKAGTLMLLHIAASPTQRQHLPPYRCLRNICE